MLSVKTINNPIIFSNLSFAIYSTSFVYSLSIDFFNCKFDFLLLISSEPKDAVLKSFFASSSTFNFDFFINFDILGIS